MKPEVIKKPEVVLTAEEVKILAEVKMQGQATLVTLSEKLGVSKNQLQKLMNAMEEKKLVKREGPVYQSIN